VTGYAGMSAMQRREREAGLYANGGAVQPRKGVVQGPGTGTSDDVPDAVQEGTYIMPADSTQAIGAKALGGMGGGFEQWAKGQGEQGQIPVQLSNGEYKMPPEQVHAVGVQALDGLKNATHTPAPERSPFKFANGGFAGFAQNQRRLHLYGGSVATQKRLEDEGRVPDSPVQIPPTPPGRIPTDLNKPITPPNPTAKGNSFGDMAAQQSGAVAQATPKTGFAGFAAQQSGEAPAAPAPAPAPLAAPTTQRDFRARQMQQASEAASARRAEWGADYDARAAQMAAEARQAAAQRTQNAALRPLRPEVSAPAASTPAAPVAAPVSSAPAVSQPTGGATVERPGQGRVLPGLEQYETKPGQTAGAGAADNALPDGVTQTSVPGVYRKGNTFSDSPEGTSYGATANAAPRPESGYGVSTVPGQPVASAGQSRFEQLAQQIANQRTPEVAHSGNDWGIRNNLRNMAVSANSIMNRPQFDRRGHQISGPSPAQAAYESALKVDEAAQGAQADVTKQGMRGQTDLLREALQQAGGLERESLQQQGADRRDAQRNAMEGKRMSFEQYAKGVELKGAVRQERLFQRYEAAKTPEEKSQIAQQIRDLSGKTQDANRFTVVPGGQEWDANAGAMRNVPSRVINNQTGQFMDQGAAQTPMENNPQAKAIRDNPKLSKEEKVAALQKLGY
jgi:hypothetical protein